MRIYVIGSEDQVSLLKSKVSNEHQVVELKKFEELEDADDVVVFDLMFDDSPDDLNSYHGMSQLSLIINSTRISLAELTFVSEETLPNLYGIAADPTFIERPLMEVSEHHKNRIKAKDLFASLGIEATIIDDRVGMVTPRVIAMIINEAYFTVQEGTANRKDIDTAMELGTNYPRGPFEWAEEWGIDNIYELLEALHLDTKDDRYKICSLLKQEYLRNS